MGKKELPDYLDPAMREKDLPQGKILYLEFYRKMMQEIPLFSGTAVLIEGAGRGLTPRITRREIDKRKEKGEDLGNVKILTVDISQEILDGLRKSTKSRRIQEGLTLADVTNLHMIPDNSCSLVEIASIMHEVQGQKGEAGVVAAFSEARRVLTPEAMLIFKEFHLPTNKRQRITLKTDFARRFFAAFEENFLPDEQADWRRNWKFLDNDKIECSAVLAFEILQHSRFFRRNLYSKKGESAFADFKNWQELEQRYSLKVPGTESTDVAIIMHSLIESTERPVGDYAYSHFLLPDREDDESLVGDFLCREINSDGSETESPLTQTNRMIGVFKKFAKEKTEGERQILALEHDVFVKRISNSVFNN